MTINLWPENQIPYYNEDIDFIPYITPYIKEGAKGAVLVCPGGGYARRAPHEGNRIGEWLNSIGITAFILEYRVAPYAAPAEGADVQRGMRVARREAAKYGIEKVAVMGFSAGGHLAGTASVHYDHPFYEPVDETDKLSARPDASILCYAVIDMHEYRHDGSRANLIGSNPKESLKEFYSLHKQITEDTPPAFLWHTAEDKGVPCVNSLLYAGELAIRRIPYELHVYPFGGHGKGLAEAEGDEHIHQWTDSLDKWLGLMGWK